MLEEAFAAAEDAAALVRALYSTHEAHAKRPGPGSAAEALAGIDRALAAAERLQQTGQRVCDEWGAFVGTIDRTNRSLSAEARGRVQLPVAQLSERSVRAHGNCEALARTSSAEARAIRENPTVARLRNGSLRSWNSDVSKTVLDVSRRLLDTSDAFLRVFKEVLPSLRVIEPVFNRLVEVARYERSPYRPSRPR